MSQEVEWNCCASSQPVEAGRGGDGLPCCVHVADDSLGSAVPAVTLFCCWCGKALLATGHAAPPPRPTSTSKRHGPLAQRSKLGRSRALRSRVER